MATSQKGMACTPRDPKCGRFFCIFLDFGHPPPQPVFRRPRPAKGGGEGGGAGGGGRGGSTNLAAARGLHPRNPHTHVGTAAGFSQGVDEELLLRDFANEEEIMAMSQEAMTVEEKDWQGIFQNFPRDCRPLDDEKIKAHVLGILDIEEFKKVDPGHISLPQARNMIEKARNRLQVLLGRELHPVVFGYLCAGIGTGKQGYHRDHPIDALPSGNISVPCVNRPFEWEVHRSVNSTTFCCVLRVTWCHRVCFSCYLRPKRGTINVCKCEVLRHSPDLGASDCRKTGAFGKI